MEYRTVLLHKGNRGFGFVLRGAKASSALMELTPNERCPGLQYLDDVDPGGVADLAGLKKGDYLVAVNLYSYLIIYCGNYKTSRMSTWEHSVTSVPTAMGTARLYCF